MTLLIAPLTVASVDGPQFFPVLDNTHVDTTDTPTHSSHIYCFLWVFPQDQFLEGILQAKMVTVYSWHMDGRVQAAFQRVHSSSVPENARVLRSYQHWVLQLVWFRCYSLEIKSDEKILENFLKYIFSRYQQYSAVFLDIFATLLREQNKEGIATEVSPSQQQQQ